MYKIALALAALALVAAGAAAQRSADGALPDFDSGFVWQCKEQAKPGENLTATAIDNPCLACLCSAMSGCDNAIGCREDPTGRVRRRQRCGPFQMTESFWRLYNSDQPESDFTAAGKERFQQCAGDWWCSARVTQNFLSRNTCDEYRPDRVYDHTTASQCEHYLLLLKVGPGFNLPANKKKAKEARQDPRWTTCRDNFALMDVPGKLPV